MRRSRRLLIALPVVNACIGFVVPGIYIGDGLPISLSRILAVVYFLLKIALSVMVYNWCQADIAERKLRYPAGIPILVGTLFTFGAPIYFFATRSALRALLDSAIAVLYTGVCLVFFSAGAYLFLRLFA